MGYLGLSQREVDEAHSGDHGSPPRLPSAPPREPKLPDLAFEQYRR